MTRAFTTIREHLHFITVACTLIVAMTFPTIIYIFNTEVFWLPTGNHEDTWIKFWDAWYGQKLFSGQANLYHTDLLFYPQGVSLVYHNTNILHMLVFGGLQAFMPAANAFSLSFLLIVASAVCSAYVYMLYLFKDKWIALLGAIIVGMSPYVVGYPEHPEYRFIATLILALYFFHRGMDERRIKLVLISAVLFGLTAYVGMHNAVCLAIALCMYILYFSISRWKQKSFWLTLGLFAVIAGLVSSIRFVPMLSSPNRLAQAIDTRGGHQVGNDLLEYFVNGRHPLTELLLQRTFSWGVEPREVRFAAYIGYTALLLIAIGLARTRYRRRMLPWLLLALPFLVLRLGTELTIDGTAYPEIVLPKRFLDDLLPGVTAGFSLTSGFYAGALIPLAALACYGACALLDSLPKRRRPYLVLLLVGLVAFECFQPVRQGIVEEQELAFVDWLDEEGDDLRLINLPISDWNSMWYMLHQTRSGFPLAQGFTARTSADARQYGDNNYLIDSWGNHRAVECTWKTQGKYLAALDQLESDGFTHVVWHRHRDWAGYVASSFAAADASYADDYVAIYRMDDLRAPCSKRFGAEFAADSPYADIYLMPSVIHRHHGLAMSFHPTQSAHPEFLPYFSQMTFDQKNAIHVSYDDSSALVIQSATDQMSSLDSIVAFNSGVWLINDARETNIMQMPIFQNWFKKHYRSCKRFLDREEAKIDLYLKREIPCDAMGDETRFTAMYDSGMQLRNLAYQLNSDQITFYLVWKIVSERTLAFSIQLFDDQGYKVHQLDQVVFRHEPLSVHSADISSLPEGSYTAKLVVYDYETGAGQSGIVSETGLRFDREFEFATIDLG